MKTVPRHRIFRRMSEQHYPARVQLELTRQCNLKCVHCMVRGAHDDPGEQMDTETVLRLMREMREAGVIHLNLTGGEPFIRPDIRDLLQAAFDEKFLVTLQTNGNLLTDRDIALLAANKQKIRQIGISLYGVTSETHDAVTLTPGSHEKARRALLALKEAGLYTVAVMVITTINHHEFHEVEAFCSDHDLAFQFNTLICPRDNGGREPLKWRLDENKLCALPKPWETFMDDLPIEPGDLTPDRPLSVWCSMGSTSCYVTADGHVRPCSTVDISAGNVRDHNFSYIWRNGEIFKKLRAFRLKDFECFRCEHFPKCHPCPGLAFMEHGEFTTPAREICRVNSVFMRKAGDTNGKKAV